MTLSTYAVISFNIFLSVLIVLQLIIFAVKIKLNSLFTVQNLNKRKIPTVNQNECLKFKLWTYFKHGTCTLIYMTI